MVVNSLSDCLSASLREGAWKYAPLQHSDIG